MRVEGKSALRDMRDDERAALARSVQAALLAPCKDYLEIGVKYAWSTRDILAALAGTDCVLTSIDPAAKAARFHARAAFDAGCGRRARLLLAESFNCKDRTPAALAWALVDGCHCEACVLDDVETYGGRIVAGGRLVLHDTSVWVEENHRTRCYRTRGRAFIGVRRAIERSAVIAERFRLVVAIEGGERPGIRVYGRQP